MKGVANSELVELPPGMRKLVTSCRTGCSFVPSQSL